MLHLVYEGFWGPRKKSAEANTNNKVKNSGKIPPFWVIAKSKHLRILFRIK